jgi:transcriptional regulator with XRE-family HTH domain
LTDYGKKIKIALIKRDMTQVELMKEIKNKTGLTVDTSYMSKIMRGLRTPPRIISAINEILEISA